MGNNNINLQSAKNSRDDEFYTTYDTIESELSHYTKHFCNKVVLCNCDDPFESNFCKFFLTNFNRLKLKRLICTSYYASKIASTQMPIIANEDVCLAHGCGYVLDTEKFCDDEDISDEIISKHLFKSGVIKPLKGDGDFRSHECIEYLMLSDIVVTNPPFSLFKELVSLLMRYHKHFLLIGNQNALTYKEIFPLIQNNEIWTGHRFGEMKFRVPDTSEPRETRFWIDETGQKWRSLGNAMWLTNLDNDRRHKILKLTKRYTPEEYPKYDLYDAINVKKVADIPYDYSGIMGVPITIIDKYNSEQFEIIGEANHGSDNEYDLFKPTINGKLLFKKILIRNKKLMKTETTDFIVLDLFSGAGGFSYGIEKNKHFKTAIALDFNEQALQTFKYNMPDTEIVHGDITDPDVKERIISLSREKKVNMIIGGPPCQGFSLKGKKLGLNDPRNFLFLEYLNIVSAINPQVFIIENVKALLSASAGWFKDQIVKKVEEMGYTVRYGVLNSSDYGVPQLRQRAIFICSKDIPIELPKPTTKKVVTVRDAIFDLAYLNSGEGTFEQDYTSQPSNDYQIKMRKGSKKLYNHKASNHAEIAIKKLSMIPPECGKEYLPEDMIGKQQFSGTWGRLKWDESSPTIDTRFDASSNGTNNHPFLNRAITPREAARLQSFDDKFVFIGPKLYIRQQIGNAVPPLMAKALADKIYDVVVKSKKGSGFMNTEMAYLIGMVLGNGEIQRTEKETKITIDIPYKNLYTDDLKDVSVYVKASTVDMRSIVEPLIGNNLIITQSKHSTKMTFSKPNSEYVVREIVRLTENGAHHSTMRMNPDLFNISTDEKKSLLKGIADVTGYIRKSNIAFGQDGAHRVYIEIPGNWYLVIDIANMLKEVDVPVQTIDFGHPNFRDGNLKKYNEGKPNFWKKEHQVKVFANEFLPIGFNIQHKQDALEKYSEELLEFIDPVKTHKFYWEKTVRRSNRPHHPGEDDPSLPAEIRGKHFDSWTDLASFLGYGK